MTTEHQKRARRMVEAPIDRPGHPDAHAREFGADDIACPHDVAAELRTTVAGALATLRGTIYRFGAVVIAFDGAGAFFGVGIECHGINFAPARSRGARW